MVRQLRHNVDDVYDLLNDTITAVTTLGSRRAFDYGFWGCRNEEGCPWPGRMRIVEICMNRGRDTLEVKATSTRRLVGDPALAWSQGLKVEVSGAGTVVQAGVVLPRLLADRLGLTTGLAEVGFVPVRHRGRALVDATCAVAGDAHSHI